MKRIKQVIENEKNGCRWRRRFNQAGSVNKHITQVRSTRNLSELSIDMVKKDECYCGYFYYGMGMVAIGFCEPSSTVGQ